MLDRLFFWILLPPKFPIAIVLYVFSIFVVWTGATSAYIIILYIISWFLVLWWILSLAGMLFFLYNFIGLADFLAGGRSDGILTRIRRKYKAKLSWLVYIDQITSAYVIWGIHFTLLFFIDRTQLLGISETPTSVGNVISIMWQTTFMAALVASGFTFGLIPPVKFWSQLGALILILTSTIYWAAVAVTIGRFLLKRPGAALTRIRANHSGHEKRFDRTVTGSRESLRKTRIRPPITTDRRRDKTLSTIHV